MRLIDADKLEVISYKDTEGREDTFDEGVRWMAEQKYITLPPRCEHCGALMDWRCR